MLTGRVGSKTEVYMVLGQLGGVCSLNKEV